MPRFAYAALLTLASVALPSRLVAGGAPPTADLVRVDWRELPGWEEDRQDEAWPALLETCDVLAARRPEWRPPCEAARHSCPETPSEARSFFELWFEPHALTRPDGSSEGLVTGYCDPIVEGSLVQSERYRYPLYAAPRDLVRPGPTSGHGGRRLRRGRRVGSELRPYWTRAEIDGPRQPLAGRELVWLADPVDRYVIHVQGSGRVRLPDGRLLALDYADQNGHPFRPIGRHLTETGALPPGGATMPAIRAHMERHPAAIASVLGTDPSYVFFSLRRDARAEALSALGVPLTPERSIAVDPRVVPLGAPAWLVTSMPGQASSPVRKLVMAQDTGGAIRGPIRVDYFWGSGEWAERMAGTMKQAGSLFVLLPRGR